MLPTIPESSVINDRWCYSYWKPGEPCPATSTAIKQVEVKNISNQVIYTLAISAAKKVLWIHHSLSGFNQLIPVTAFYDELLRAKHIRDAKLISHPATFFDRVNDFTDSEY